MNAHLEVAMDDVLAMDVAQTKQNLIKEIFDVKFGEILRRGDDLLEIL